MRGEGGGTFGDAMTDVDDRHARALYLLSLFRLAIGWSSCATGTRSMLRYSSVQESPERERKKTHPVCDPTEALARNDCASEQEMVFPDGAEQR